MNEQHNPEKKDLGLEIMQRHKLHRMCFGYYQVTPGQLMRPSIGRNAFCDCKISPTTWLVFVNTVVCKLFCFMLHVGHLPHLTAANVDSHVFCKCQLSELIA